MLRNILKRSISTNRALPVNTVIKFVPQQEAWIVERMGKFHRILDPGLAILIPILDEIKYVQSLKEVAIEIPSQSAITEDNVTLNIDGVLYVKVVDAMKASYGIENPGYAVTQLAQTTMRAEIGMMTLDKTLSQRASLNASIVEAINLAASDWGIKCLRYEIRDIHPPEEVVQAMHSQVSAERQKRADILQSEGQRQAAINVAEGLKQSTILAADAQQQEKIYHAKGESEAILLQSTATAESINRIASAIANSSKGPDAVTLQIAEKYIESFSKLAQKGTTVILPADAGNPTSMVAQAMGIFTALNGKKNETKNAIKEAKQVNEKIDFPIN